MSWGLCQRLGKEDLATKAGLAGGIPAGDKAHVDDGAAKAALERHTEALPRALGRTKRNNAKLGTRLAFFHRICLGRAPP